MAAHGAWPKTGGPNPGGNGKKQTKNHWKKKSFVSAFQDLIVNLEVRFKMFCIFCKRLQANRTSHSSQCYNPSLL